MVNYYNTLSTLSGQFLPNTMYIIFLFLPSAPNKFDEEMRTDDFYAYLNGQGMSLGDYDKIRGNN